MTNKESLKDLFRRLKVIPASELQATKDAEAMKALEFAKAVESEMSHRKTKPAPTGFVKETLRFTRERLDE